MTRRVPLLAALLVLAFSSWATDAAATGGDLVSTTVLRADWNGDAVGGPPDVTLPGDPEGDYLTLEQAGGSVKVLASCGGFVKPVEMKQNFCPGGVALNAWLAPRPAGTQSVIVRWRSFARDYFGPLMRCEVRGANGALVASVDYRPLGILKYNLKNLLPVRYVPGRAQDFTIAVDLVQRKTSLSINGAPVTGCQGIPFAEPTSDVGRLTFEGDDGHAQALYIDDISVVALSPPSDRAPELVAPASVTGAEGSLLSLAITATDPDGDAITSLSAAPLPAGATFQADASNTSGVLEWTPDFQQAGAYSVTFTAVSSLTSTVTTAITIADVDRGPVVVAPKAVDGEEGGTLSFTVTASDPDGEAISGWNVDLSTLPPGHEAVFTPGADPASGALVWHMKPGEAGSYVVVFEAVNGGAGSAQTNINVAVAGVSVTGSLVWTPRPGEEGSHIVTFSAVDDSGFVGTATTEIICTAPPSGLAALNAASRGPAPQGAMAPKAIQKGPVVSAPRSAAATTGTTVVVNATATAGVDGLAAAARPGIAARAGALLRSTASLTLTADLSEVARAQFHVDKDPEIAAPATVEVEVGGAVSIPVTVADPDGDPILSLTADRSGLPDPNNAAFTSNDSHTSGLFTWTPGAADSGNYTVTFTAANNLVGSASTAIHVRGAAPARVFLEDSRRIKLSSKGTVSVYIEPVACSFDLLDVDLASVRMISPGTGSVAEIPAVVGKNAAIGDRDCNHVQDLQLCFKVSDMKLLFANLRGYVTARVTIAGRLRSGGSFQGGVDLRLDAGQATQHASIFPNPLNPRATLSFSTARPGPASVRLFDIKGRLVRELLVAPSLEAGDHRVEIDGRDGGGRVLASGVYYFRVEAEGRSETGRFSIMK